MDAPPVASAGDPKNPCRNRRTRSPAKWLTSAVGTQRITKSPKVIRYGTFRPTIGTSLKGENNIGPTPSGSISERFW